MRRLSFSCLLLLSAFLAREGFAQTDTKSSPEIKTSGSGTRPIKPDLVTVAIAIGTHEKTAVAAGRSNAKIATSIRAALIGIGIPGDSIVTQDYIVRAEPRWQGDTLAYYGSNTVLARIRNLRLISRAIDTALTAGATNISGVNFSADDDREAFRLALSQAVEEATRSAETMAKAAGGRLGPLISLTTESERIWNGGLNIRGGSDFTPITAGPLTVTANVIGRWEFIPGR